mmetsp:Transcript_47610/g.72011  ORF Transcript_47610/g.72011 Transcript_47610/m.72011 type:complete len:104 (-) Transcript_47610:325-636(-)
MTYFYFFFELNQSICECCCFVGGVIFFGIQHGLTMSNIGSQFFLIMVIFFQLEFVFCGILNSCSRLDTLIHNVSFDDDVVVVCLVVVEVSSSVVSSSSSSNKL